jgi:hypothetical protein
VQNTQNYSWQVFLPEDLRQRVVEIAHRDGIPRVAVVRMAVSAWLDLEALLGRNAYIEPQRYTPPPTPPRVDALLAKEAK